ncbi:MAG: hypothetical protein ACR2HX_17310 [Pyrinomonadaceae bacterium]
MRYLLLFVLLLCWLPLTAEATNPPDEKQSLTADEIINKHLEVSGGKEALTKFQSRIAVGTVKKESDPEARMAIMSEAPNHVTGMFIFNKFDWQLTYDGSKSFIRPLLPRESAPIQDRYQAMLSSGLMFNSISLYNVLLAKESSGAKFEAKGLKKVKDRQAYVVEMKRPKGISARLYFDATTFMWLRTDYGTVHISKPIGQFTNEVVPHGEDELRVDFYFETSDFRDVAGVKLPFKFELVVTYPIITQKRVGTISGTIIEYQHNVQIDPKMFK